MGLMGPVGPALRRWWLLYSVPLGIFAISRVLDAILIAEAVTHQSVAIGAGDRPPYREVDSASYGDAVMNWDGQWYRRIAENGYPTDLPRADGEVSQNSWIFLPLYPALVRLVMILSQLPFPAAASIVSIGGAAAAMCVVHRLLLSRSTPFSAALGVLALSFFPSAPIFQVAYSEGLALLLLSSCVLLLHRRRYGWLAVAVVLFALTRAVALPLVLVIGLHGLVRWRRRDVEPFPVRERWGVVVAGAAAGGSFLLWPAVAAVVTGEPDAYFATREAWFSQGSVSSSWLAGMGTGEVAAGVLALLAFAVLLGLLLRPRARAWAPELRVWAGLYGMFLLVATGPGGGVFRYALLTIVPWWPMPSFPQERIPRAARYAIVVLMTGIGLATQYLWLRWFFITGPSSLNFP